MNGLLTDLYELTMSAGYFEAGKAKQKATFELSVRRLPTNRNFVIAAGLPQCVDYLLNLRFTAEEIDYLRGLPQFTQVSPAFFDYLRDFRFTGDLFAVPEGTPLFAGEPMLMVRAPLIEAQIPETYLLSAITFQSLIATKAARMVEAGDGRGIVEFGTRRAHTPEAGVLAARAAYIGGCIGTSNALTGLRYGIPVFGTAAHSWVLSFPNELDSFRQLQKLLGPQTVQLIDTYDTIEGARRAAALGRPLWGVRLDSGDIVTLSRQVRAILDEAGLPESKIMVTGDLDEYRIRDIVREARPSTFSAWAPNSLPRATRLPWAPSTSWSRWISAASSASPPSSARTKGRCPARSRFSASPIAMCWVVPPNAAAALRHCYAQ